MGLLVSISFCFVRDIFQVAVDAHVTHLFLKVVLLHGISKKKTGAARTLATPAQQKGSLERLGHSRWDERMLPRQYVFRQIVSEYPRLVLS